MKTLKLSLTALVLLFAMNLTAQETAFGIRAGVNFQNINGDDADGESLENDLLTGFHAGFSVDVPLAPDFYIQPGLIFSTKGAKNEETILNETLTTKLRLGYLEVPINLLYKPLLGEGHLLLGFGPYVAWGITGNTSLETMGNETDIDVKFTSSVDPGDDEDLYYVKRFDAGANMLAGYEFAGGVFFQINAQLGLVDIYPEYEMVTTDDDVKFNNTGFGLSLGYRFK